LDIAKHGVNEAGLGTAVGLEIESQALNQGRADDSGIGGARHLGGLFWGPDAEAHRYR
jgi:hypothetical protein